MAQFCTVRQPVQSRISFLEFDFENIGILFLIHHASSSLIKLGTPSSSSFQEIAQECFYSFYVQIWRSPTPKLHQRGIRHSCNNTIPVQSGIFSEAVHFES